MRDAGVSSGAGGVWAAPVAGVALGVGAVAAGPLTPYAAAGSVGGVGVAAGSLAAGVWSWRRARRDAALDKLRLALSPLIGGSSVSKVQGSGWSGGWVGTPTRLRLHYDPQVRSHDPKWEPAIRETCQARLGSRFSIEQHDQRQCQIVLRADPVVLESAAAAEVRRRTERNLIRLLGPTAKIVSIATAEGVATRVEASHEDSPRFAPAGYRARVERAFSDTMPGRWRARWDLERDRVIFEMRPELPDTIWLPTPQVPPGDYLMHNYREVSILLAVDEDGQQVHWYPAKVPHLLACGGTGTGKTSLTHGIVGQFAKFGWPVWISDAKGGEFIDFRDYPNVQIIASSTYQHVALINQALAVVEHRYSLVEAGLAKTRDFTPLVVILDEFAELREDLHEWYPQVKGPKGESKPPTLRQVGRLARKARTARVHLVVALQRPDVAFLGGEALALDTPIPTPQGWTTMGEIQPGDIVYDHNGAPTVVTTATPVAHGRPCFRVTFSDDSTFVTDANHRWLAHSASRRVSLASTYVPLTRAERWPHHLTLVEHLACLKLDDTQEVTVAEFEAAVGQGRLSLLRRLLMPSQTLVDLAGLRPGTSGRYEARTYRVGDLKKALTDEVAAAPRTGRPTGGEIVTTEQMARSLTAADGGSNWSVDVAGPILGATAGLPIDPWLLGYWLGDGHKAGATIATNDDEVLTRIRDLGFRVTHYGRFNYGISTGPRGHAADSTLVGALRGLGLLHNKHIPANYLRASVTQREALLAGLLDSDGTCSVRGRDQPSGQVVFTNVNSTLIEGVAELVASLGFIPSVRQLRPPGVESHPSSVAYGRPTRAAFAVSFTPDRQVFALTRKQAVLKPSLAARRRATTSRRYVTGIEPVESVPVRCIAVAAPEHLYLAGQRFIPTHNTRDNFGQRISFGRLSPQGAMMMWDSVVTGVSLPRGKPGRAIAMNEASVPVEVQCFRFPEMDALPGSEAHAFLQELRPAEAVHPRLVVVPAEEALAEHLGITVQEAATRTTFWDFARAPWALAADRPDLDPVLAMAGVQISDRQALASPMTVLGLNEVCIPNYPGRVVGGRQRAGRDVAEPSEPTSVEEEWPGFGDPEAIPAHQVQAGDVVLVDEGLDRWAQIQLPPEEDLLDPDRLAMFWRDADGDEETLSVECDEPVLTRRPVLDGPAYGEPLPADEE